MVEMSEIRTMTEHLADLITGKEKLLTCSGYPLPDTHEVTEWQVDIGRHWYSCGCPICGFGSGGSLSEKDSEYLRGLVEKTVRIFNSTQSDAEPGITRFPTKSYREYVQSLQGKVKINE